MIKVAKISDVPNFGKKTITVSDQEVMLINEKGTIYAVENECPHQGAPLSASIVKNGFLSCPRHGYLFSLTDGSCKEHPEFTLRTYRVEISGDDILLDV